MTEIDLSDAKIKKELDKIGTFVSWQVDEHPFLPYITVPLMLAAILDSIENIETITGKEGAEELFKNVQGLLKEKGYKLERIKK